MAVPEPSARLVALSIASLVAVLVAVPGASARAELAEVWERVHDEAPVAGASGVLETRWQSTRPSETQPGSPSRKPSDRIQVHRYRAQGKSRAALLYLPGTNMNGELAVAEERYNLWLYLAARGIEVFALDYRTHFISNDDPSDAGSHQSLLDWTIEAFTNDNLSALALARTESGHDRPFVAGFSRGVTFAWALACTEPGPLGGLVILDGTFKKHERSESFDYASAREELISSGRYAADVAGRMGFETRHALMSAASTAPEGPATREGHATIGEQVGSILYEAWRPGALANPVGGFSRPQILARLLDGYDRWWPAIQNVEGRSIAEYTDDPRTSVDDRWGELTLPVLYFGATGMGAEWILDGVYSSVKSGSEDVEIHVLEGWGHLDVLVGEHAAAEVFAPTAKWIGAHLD